jgi:SAM-dependent methyltransferase
MAHPEQDCFVTLVKEISPQYFQNTKVLEIGSADLNGSIRKFFHGCEYIGLDLGPYNGVDIICPGEKYDAPDESFDVVASTECFEHTGSWADIFSNMYRMCKKGGLIFFTCASHGRAEHGTLRTDPQASPFTGHNYYRNLNESDFRELFNINDMFIAHRFEYNPRPRDLYFWGIKKTE